MTINLCNTEEGFMSCARNFLTCTLFADPQKSGSTATFYLSTRHSLRAQGQHFV